MHRFAVWAPGRLGVELVVDGRSAPMTLGGGGWWQVVDTRARAGSRYGFSLDGGPLRPDPRSPFQPEGVLGPSELVDHGAYAWTDQGWRGGRLEGRVLYELHVGTFSQAGTFDGAIERIPHLVELGIDTVELMPVAEFSGERGWGYDAVDLYAPHHAYGGPVGLKRLVDACHRAGLAVVLDVVYNHLGPAGNFLPEFGPYFSDRHRTAWGAALNFDGKESAEVRRFVIDNATAWVRDYHIDGLRLDAVHAIVDRSQVHILKELAVALKAAGSELGREVFLIAESNSDDATLIRDRSGGGYGLDGVWSDDWHHALHALLTGEREGYYSEFGSFERLALALRQAWVRRELPRGLPPERLVIAAQTHDQIGNRAAGERLAGLVGNQKLELAAALLLTSPFTPLLFQGEEWAASTPFLYFTDHLDPELARMVSEGRRRDFAAFGWKPEEIPDPQDAATFERSKLRWDEIGRPRHRKVLEWYRNLIALRRRLPAATLEQVRATADESRGTVTFARPGLELCADLRRGTLTLDEKGRRFA